MFDLSSLYITIKDHNDFIEKCNSLPKKEADKLRAERKAKYENKKSHQRALEIAEAGRARNFWGN